MGLFQLAYKNISQRKARFILTTLSVVIGVMFVVGVFLLTDGLRSTFGGLADDITGSSDATVRSAQEFGDRINAPPLPASVGEALENAPDVVAVSPGLAEFGVILTDLENEEIDPGFVGAPVIGINWDPDTNDSLFLVPSYGDGTGKIPEVRDEFAVDFDTAEENNMRLGEDYIILVPSGSFAGRHMSTLVGVFNFAEEEESQTLGALLVAFDNQTASELFNDGRGFDFYDVFLSPAADRSQTTENLTAAVNASPQAVEELADARVQIEVVDREEIASENQEMFNSVLDIFRNVLLGFAFIILLVSTFVIYNTFSIVLDQRIREMGLLRALGIKGGQLQRLILGEAVIVGLFATVIGFALGVGIFYLLILVLGALSGGDFPSVPFTVNYATIIWALAVGVGITVLSALAPAIRSRRISPVEAIREGGAATRQTEVSLLPIVGAVVSGVGVVLAVLAIASTSWDIALSNWILLVGFSLLAMIALYWGGTRIMKWLGRLAVLGLGILWLILAAIIDLKAGESFALYGVGAIIVFAGVNMVSPLFGAGAARALGAPFQAIYGIVGRLGVENSARNPRRTASTSGALMIGLALVSTAAILTTSFQASFANLLEQSIRSDWIVCRTDCGSPDPTQTFTASMAERIDALEETESAVGFRFVSDGMRVSGVYQPDGSLDSRTDVFDVFGSRLNEVDRHLKLDLRQGSSNVADRNSAFVYVDRANAYDLSVGSRVEVEFLADQFETITIAGIFDDNNVIQSDWIFNQEIIDTYYPDRRDFFVTVIAAAGFTVEEMREVITRVAHDIVPRAGVYTREEFRDELTDDIDQVLIVVSAFLGISFVVAILGIANTLSLSIFERIREIGLLRAVGMKRSQVRRMVRLEGLVVALFGCILGIGLGVLFGVIGVWVIPDSFVSTLSIRPMFLIIYAIVGAVAGLLSTLLPASRAGRLNILQAISYE